MLGSFEFLSYQLKDWNGEECMLQKEMYSFTQNHTFMIKVIEVSDQMWTLQNFMAYRYTLYRVTQPFSSFSWSIFRRRIIIGIMFLPIIWQTNFFKMNMINLNFEFYAEFIKYLNKRYNIMTFQNCFRRVFKCFENISKQAGATKTYCNLFVGLDLEIIVIIWINRFFF